MKDLQNFFNKKRFTQGELVRAFRTNYKITQQELCDVTGINRQNLSAIENGRREIGIETAKKLAVVFGIDPTEFLFPNGFEDLLGNYQGIRQKTTKLLKRKKVI